MATDTTLVTGATGFIGKRLVVELASRGRAVRALVRRNSTVPLGAVAFHGDLLDPFSLLDALKGIDTAYYLVHALKEGNIGYEQRDRIAAEFFTDAANRNQVRRVIYLGGLGEEEDRLSKHLTSRREVVRILNQGNFRTTFLRAPIIIGRGGASFEMMRALVENLPFLLVPNEAKTQCQPVAVSDVIACLAGCLENEATAGKSFGICGPEVMSYKEMLQRLARILRRYIPIISVPFLPSSFASYAAAIIAPMNPGFAFELVEGMKNQVVCNDQQIREFVPMPLTTYDEAVRKALAEVTGYSTFSEAESTL